MIRSPEGECEKPIAASERTSASPSLPPSNGHWTAWEVRLRSKSHTEHGVSGYRVVVAGRWGLSHGRLSSCVFPRLVVRDERDVSSSWMPIPAVPLTNLVIDALDQQVKSGADAPRTLTRPSPSTQSPFGTDAGSAFIIAPKNNPLVTLVTFFIPFPHAFPHTPMPLNSTSRVNEPEPEHEHPTAERRRGTEGESVDMIDHAYIPDQSRCLSVGVSRPSHARTPPPLINQGPRDGTQGESHL